MCDKIYVVTKGDYSDYHIVGCFTSKELAERYSGEHSQVEEYEANPDSDKLNEGLQFYNINMELSTGDVESCHVATKDWCSCMMGDFSIRYTHNTSKGGTIKCLFGRAWAKSRNHMIKITSEKRREVLALGEDVALNNGGV